MEPTTPDINSLLEEAANLKKQMDAARNLKDRYDEIKYEIQIAMQNAHSKRSEPIAGIYAVRKETTSIVIEDYATLAEYLDNNEDIMDPMVYYKIDAAAIKKLADERMRDYGEFLPGTRAVTVETVAISAAKK